jgi:hypothetical protein
LNWTEKFLVIYGIISRIFTLFFALGSQPSPPMTWKEVYHCFLGLGINRCGRWIHPSNPWKWTDPSRPSLQTFGCIWLCPDKNRHARLTHLSMPLFSYHHHCVVATYHHCPCWGVGLDPTVSSSGSLVLALLLDGGCSSQVAKVCHPTLFPLADFCFFQAMPGPGLILFVPCFVSTPSARMLAASRWPTQACLVLISL